MNCKTKIHIPFHSGHIYPEKTSTSWIFQNSAYGAELYAGCSFLLTTSSFFEAFGDWETLIFIAKDNTFRNRGFFYGPWLPVYGIGAAVFYCLFHSSRETISIRSLHKSNRLFLFKTKYHPLTIFIKTALLGTALELVIGWFLDIFFDLRYWDYSSYPFNFHGYICLLSAVGFGVAGMLWICVFSEISRKLWFSLPPGFRRGFNSVLILLFLADCAAALIFPNTGHGITF